MNLRPENLGIVCIKEEGWCIVTVGDFFYLGHNHPEEGLAPNAPSLWVVIYGLLPSRRDR